MWNTFLLKQSEKTKKAQKYLCNKRGNPFIGVYEVKFKTLNVTFLQDHPPQTSGEDSTAAMLCSNVLTSVEKDKDGVLNRIYSPIELVQLKGSKGHVQTFDLNPNNSFFMHDLSDVQAWLQTLEKQPIAIKLNVLCCYKFVNPM